MPLKIIAYQLNNTHGVNYRVTIYVNWCVVRCVTRVARRELTDFIDYPDFVVSYEITEYDRAD